MEITCWRCRAVFDPTVSAGRCPNCGHHPHGWMAKLSFAAGDFLGPIFLLGFALYHSRDDSWFTALFLIGALVWLVFICYQDIEDWAPITPLSRPKMPDSWKERASVRRRQESAATSISDGYNSPYRGSGRRRASGLTWPEKLLIATLLSSLIVYFFLHWKQFKNFVAHGQISAPLMYTLVIVGFITYAVRRTRFDKEVLQDGVLTPGILTGWYDKSGYSRTGSYRKFVRIRYQFWTESGQKFEGSGTLNPWSSLDSLSLNQEPLKVYYLPSDPGKNVALCCTTIPASSEGQPE
jgi:hypothetical protein